MTINVLCDQSVLGDVRKGLLALRTQDTDGADTCFRRGIERIGQIKLEAMDESTLNSCWLAHRFTQFLAYYADFWETVKLDQVEEAWTPLQRARHCSHDLMCLVDDVERWRVDWLDRQVRYLDAAYPYNVFFSMGSVVHRATCSICGKDIADPDCPHETGKLYRGEMACTVIQEFDVGEVSIVTNPVDRLCVAKPAGLTLDYRAVRRLIHDMPSPFFEVKVLRPARVILGAGGKVGRNDLCPCGSGKKFKRCCLDVWFTDSSLYDLNIGDEVAFWDIPLEP